VNDREDLGADAIPGSCFGLLLLFVGRTSGPSRGLNGLEVRRMKGLTRCHQRMKRPWLAGTRNSPAMAAWRTKHNAFLPCSDRLVSLQEGF